MAETEVLDANNAEGSSPDEDEKGVDSSTTQNGEETETSQGGAETAGAEQTPFHEHPRWKELQQKLKTLEESNSRYEQMLSEIEKEPPQEAVKAESAKPDIRAELIQGYVDLGAPEDKAAQLVDRYMSLIDSRLSPVGGQLNQIIVDKRIESFRSNPENKNYDKYEPEMTKIFSGFDENMKRAIAASPNGLRFLYDLAEKGELQKSITNADKRKGGIAGSGGTVANSNAGSKWTREKIAALSLEQFTKYEDEINAAVAKGEIE